jgi:uncharacterized SAM-binding protein YcdF (DUF218 family)
MTIALSLRRRFSARRLVFITIAALLVLALLLPYGLIARDARPDADALVILSGSDTYIERAQWAAQLWRQGRAPRIILTNDGQRAGWDERRQRNPSFTEREADVLRANGVPEDRIELIPALVTNTHQEAVQVRLHAQERGLRSVLFVTSAYHTRRAGWVVRRVFAGCGIEVGLDAPPPGQQTPPPWRWWSTITGWKLVPGEYLKFLYYWLKY